jgi:PAS domain S-box-containing protein
MRVKMRNQSRQKKHRASSAKGRAVQHKRSSDRYQKLYAMLLEAIPSSVLLVDRELRVTSANRNFLERSKRLVSDTLGRRLDEVFPDIILEQMDLTRRIQEVFEKSEPVEGERMTYRAPGVPMRIYYYSILPFSWNGVVENAMLLMDDVTEQVRLSEEVRRVERHLASVVESASDIVLSADTRGTILTWNTAAEKVSGYTFHEVKGRFFFEYCARNHHKEVRTVFSEMKTRSHSIMAEWDLVTTDGALIPVSWVCSPMKDDFSRTVAIVLVGRDLTERRKFEAQLLQSQKLAALGVMAGGIAHEIRNPLAISSSAAQFITEDDVTPQFMRECADKIQAGIQRATVIIENLLRFARPAERAEMSRMNLLAVLTETLTLVRNQARIQKIKLTSDFPKEPLLISGIPSLLQQAFMNLFLNAINAMPNGGTLSLSVRRTDRAVSLHITDTGYGISRENMDKIFDPFYTTSPVGKGTGLGLSITYSIVKQHFGSIEVDSVEGKGSTFTVKLPVS